MSSPLEILRGITTLVNIYLKGAACFNTKRPFSDPSNAVTPRLMYLLTSGTCFFFFDNDAPVVTYLWTCLSTGHDCCIFNQDDFVAYGTLALPVKISVTLISPTDELQVSSTNWQTEQLGELHFTGFLLAKSLNKLVVPEIWRSLT